MPQRRWDEASAKILVSESSLLVDSLYPCTSLWKPCFLRYYMYELDGFFPRWDSQGWLQDDWIPSWKLSDGSIQIASPPVTFIFLSFHSFYLFRGWHKSFFFFFLLFHIETLRIVPNETYLATRRVRERVENMWLLFSWDFGKLFWLGGKVMKEIQPVPWIVQS